MDAAMSIRERLFGPSALEGLRDECGVLLGRYLVGLANHLYLEDRVNADLPVELSRIICGTASLVERLRSAGFLIVTETGVRVSPEGYGLLRRRRQAHDLQESFVVALAKRFNLTLYSGDAVRRRPAPVLPPPAEERPAVVHTSPTPLPLTEEDRALLETYGTILTEIANVVRLNDNLPIITTLLHRVIQWVHAQCHLNVRFKYVREVRETLATLDLISRVQSSVNPALYNWSLTMRGARLVEAAGRIPTMTEKMVRFQIQMNPTML